MTLCVVQVVQDVKYFQRVKWQYMILDEAQAIKSSSRYVQSLLFTKILHACICIIDTKSIYIHVESPRLCIFAHIICTAVYYGNEQTFTPIFTLVHNTCSVRWRVLLSFNCRNRLLLTGTPIQNTMQELWALLHFIMPTMFDSHEEFNEWFSRDIESHAEKKSALDESQLSRLHMILKPFMLRRIKRDVEHEMAEKVTVV